MNRKTINKIISKKHEDFLKSITDENVRKLVDKNSIITGGSIVSLLLNETVKDFDYYFVDKETCKAVAEYYVNKFIELHPDWEKNNTKTCKPEVREEDDRIKIFVKSAGIAGEGSENGYEYFESLPDQQAQEYVEKIISEADDTDSKPLDDVKEKYRPVYMSENAITLSDKVQLVIRFYGEAEEIHKNYDFVHCTNYWTSKDRKLTLLPNALEAILTKQLYYQGSLYPVCSVIRTRKFIKQGWHINAGQFLKMCFQISELDLKDINILQEQLTGVDAAYFFQVIEYCKKKQEEDKDFKITAPYLVSIIDKIFG
jgi:hypothetical protein